jgi:hypothetical protein
MTEDKPPEVETTASAPPERGHEQKPKKWHETTWGQIVLS